RAGRMERDVGRIRTDHVVDHLGTMRRHHDQVHVPLSCRCQDLVPDTAVANFLVDRNVAEVVIASDGGELTACIGHHASWNGSWTPLSIAVSSRTTVIKVSLPPLA